MADIIERDAGGKIVRSKLSSNQARSMARSRWDKDRNAKIEALLEEKGYDLETAPASLLLWAEKSVSGKTGNVSAQARFEAWGRDKEDINLAYDPTVDTCPVCGRPPFGDEVWVDFNRIMFDWCEHYRRDAVGFGQFLAEVFDKYPPFEAIDPSQELDKNHEQHGGAIGKPKSLID